MSIRKWKRWYQIIVNGYSIAQFLSRKEAECYIFILQNNRGQETQLKTVNQHRGYTIRRINYYP